MTLDEFLDDYVPRVLRPMGGWRLVTCGWVRRDDPSIPECREACPLTAERHKPPSDWQTEKERLGLEYGDAQVIANAADVWSQYTAKESAVRARLLAGLGLSEGR